MWRSSHLWRAPWCPIGWMLDAQGLTVCPGDGPMQQAHVDMPMPPGDAGMPMDASMTMDHSDAGGSMDHDGHGKAPAQSGHHDVCPRAAAAHLASTPDVPQLALPAFHAFAATTDRAYASTVAARFAPHAPRGPPTFA